MAFYTLHSRVDVIASTIDADNNSGDGRLMGYDAGSGSGVSLLASAATATSDALSAATLGPEFTSSSICAANRSALLLHCLRGN